MDSPLKDIHALPRPRLPGVWNDSDCDADPGWREVPDRCHEGALPTG